MDQNKRGFKMLSLAQTEAQTDLGSAIDNLIEECKLTQDLLDSEDLLDNSSFIKENAILNVGQIEQNLEINVLGSLMYDEKKDNETLESKVVEMQDRNDPKIPEKEDAEVKNTENGEIQKSKNDIYTIIEEVNEKGVSLDLEDKNYELPEEDEISSDISDGEVKKKEIKEGLVILLSGHTMLVKKKEKKD